MMLDFEVDRLPWLNLKITDSQVVVKNGIDRNFEEHGGVVNLTNTFKATCSEIKP